MKKKIALIALAVTAALFTACAAENTPSAVSQQESGSAVSSEDKTTALTEEAAKETVKLNMPIADKFYAIYNRCSLPVDNSASVTDDNGFCYSPVESVYDTLASLKADTEKYFTKEYLDSTFYKNLADETAFYKDINGKLYKNTDAVSNGKNIWDTTAVKSNMVYTLCKHMVYMLSITNEHKNELEIRAKPEWKVHFLCFASAKRGSFSIR